MRILHVVSSLNVGGAERFVIDLAYEQQQSNQAEVTILSMGKEGEPLEDELKRLSLNKLLLSHVNDIRKHLSNYDLVHVHSSHCLLRVLLASLFKKIQVVYTRHNERAHSSLKWRIIYKLASLKLSKMIFVAEKAKENYLKVYPNFKNKVITILNGVLPITNKKTPSATLRLGHIGRFVPLKAQHFLIEAIATLPSHTQEKVSLSFFGTGETMAFNQKLAKEKIANVETKFHGFVTDRDAIYSQIDVLVVTSETEGLSLAILEALASGTPTIASEVGGNPELVNHKKNGFLYDYGNSEQLANHIETFIENNNLITEYGAQCLSNYQENFSMKQCAEQYFNAYQDNK